MIIDSSAVITSKGSPIMNMAKREEVYFIAIERLNPKNGKKTRLKNDLQSGDENQDDIKYFIWKISKFRIVIKIKCFS